MKNKAFITFAVLIAGCTFANAEVAINAKNFPDLDFRTWVQKHFDKPNGAVLTDEELASVKEIPRNPDGGGFTSVENLKGIEYFSELETLEILNDYNTNNKVRGVDLSKNKKLKKFSFNCYNGAYLSSANLKDLPNLETVIMYTGSLSGLDLRGCPHLKTIKVNRGGLTYLTTDLLCEELDTLDVSANKLTYLDLKRMPNLKYLNFSDNNITNIDLSPLKELESLNCASNDLASLDMSDNKKLKILDCGGTALEVFPTLPSCIESIRCNSVTAFASVDLSAYPNLKELSARMCELKDFDASKMQKLESLNLYGNRIALIDLSCLKNLNPNNTDLYQEITPTAIQSVRGMSILLPNSFDLGKVYSYDFNDEVDRENQILYSEYFTGSDGTKLPSFFVNFFRTGRVVFYYTYRTGFYYNRNGEQAEMLMPVNVIPTLSTSGVEDLATAKVVNNVQYFDLHGHESASPFSGFNIEVTQFADGTSQSKKLVK